MVSPMPSLRHLAASLSFRASMSLATDSAFSSALSLDSMENMAFRASAAQSLILGLTLARMLRSKWTMHRW